VSRTAKIIEQMRRSPQNIRFDDLAKVCADHFGEPRQEGTSRTRSTRRHGKVTPAWTYRQRGKDGSAEPYRVRQVLDPIARLEAEKNEEGDDDA
jgi:hypothetical protein